MKHTYTQNIKKITFKNVEYKQLKMSDYLDANENEMTVEERTWIFQWRTCDTEVKSNRKWKHTNLKCDICDTNEIETQSHTLTCKVLMELNNQITYIPHYLDLYGDDLEEKFYVSDILKGNIRIREEIIALKRPM